MKEIFEKKQRDECGDENISYIGTQGNFKFFQTRELSPAWDGVQGPKDTTQTTKKVTLEDGPPKDTVSRVKDSPPEDEDEGTQRQQWSSPIEFLLSCIALSVGLGNVWRFPVTAYKNGGGAFLIPYLIVLIFIGRPLYFLELSLGQFSSYGCIKLWKAVPGIKGIGYAQICATVSILTYYVSIMAITIFYFCASFQSVLPWSVCDESWADMDSCRSIVGNYSTTNSTNTSVKIESSVEQYFKRYVTHEVESWSSGLGLPDWKLALCLAVAWLVLFITLSKGVKSAGKVAYFTALFPYVVLITLLIRGVTLPGATEGMLYFITPQWEKLLDPNVWYAAVTQSFFSLSVSFGSIAMFSSYNDFKHNVYKDAWIISIMDTCTSMLAGLTIFSVLGNLKYQINAASMDEVVQGGPGLAFVAYPTAIAKFDYVPQVFAVLFFLMLFTLGLGSASALTNGVITVLLDHSPHWSKLVVSGVVCFIGFLSGIVYLTPQGLYIMELIDFFGGGTIVFILAILEALAISWIYGTENITRDFKFMLGIDLGIYWKVCWGVIIPIGLTGILAYSFSDFQLPTYNNQPLPATAYWWGIGLLVVSLSTVPFCLIHAIMIADMKPGLNIFQQILFVMKPKETWGPKRKADRHGWHQSKREHANSKQRSKQTKNVTIVESGGVDNPQSVGDNI